MTKLLTAPQNPQSEAKRKPMMSWRDNHNFAELRG